MHISDHIINVIDIETTGRDPKIDKVVELGVVPCSVRSGVFFQRTYTTLIDPGIPIPASASAIHHITDEDVVGAIELPSLIQSITSGNKLIAAHNASFESSFLGIESVLCTMRLAQKLWPDLECYTNQFLRYHLKLSFPPSLGIKQMPTHRALPDALVTAYLLVRELEEVIRRAKDPDAITFSGLVEWISQPTLLKMCRFGKHRGTEWSQVPKSYLRWMISDNGMKDLDIDTRYTVEFYLGMKEPTGKCQ